MRASSSANPTATAGDVDLGDLFDAHAHALLRLVERLSGAGGHVEDIVQDVFLIAHRRRGELLGADKPRSWLYAVAANLCRNHLRRYKRRDGLRQRWGTRPTAPPPPGPDEVAERDEQGRLVRACIAALPPKYREVVVLYELEGMEGAEIAALLGVPKNTVWTRLRVGRDKLRALLVKRGVAPGGAR